MTHRHTIDTFLAVYEQEICPEARASIRDAAGHYFKDSKTPLHLGECPEPLRDALRRVIINEAYERRSRGEKFNPGIEVMPAQGAAKSSTLNLCRI